MVSIAGVRPCRQGLVKPRVFVPIHGEYRHLTLHTRLAQAMGMTPDQTWVLANREISSSS